jgi:hypothetical protein
MSLNYRDYQPMVLDRISVQTLKSEEYKRFIRRSTLEPGVRLVLTRRKIRPDWPFVDTKFNPNSGQDLPGSSYDVIYSWFLGRGSEALVGHLAVLDTLDGLSPQERDEAGPLLRKLVQSMTQAIVRIMAANKGRCPFRVNRDYKAVDERGQTIAMPTDIRSAGDTFCAKGLIAEGTPGNVQRGVRMLIDDWACVKANKVGSDQGVDIEAKIGQGSRMLLMAAPLLLASKTQDRAMRTQVLDLAAEGMKFVLDHHWDASAGRFAEYLDEKTMQRLSYLDPGHANEFVGLSLNAIEAMEAEPGWLNDDRRALIARAKAELPRMLIWSTETGFNHVQHGLHKAVDGVTGQVINDDMPWWNLPETMRSAVRCLEVVGDEATRARLLELFRISHNAYFEHYLNRDKMLFPYQTRSGATGQVVNKVPAVPEGDPLYHTNLSMLDMLDVIERLGSY